MPRNTCVLASACLALLLLAGCTTDGQTPAQTAAAPMPASAPSSGKAVSGRFTGKAESNWGDTARCRATMTIDLVAADGKVTGTVAGSSGSRSIDAKLGPDGRFESSYQNNSGQPVNVAGELSTRATVISIWNPLSCGYRNVPLKA